MIKEPVIDKAEVAAGTQLPVMEHFYTIHGVGPMTIAALMKNTFRACALKHYD